MRGIINIIFSTPLGYLMRLCLQITQSYGLAVILLTVFVKVIMLPLNVWVHKNSIKMIKLQPELNMIQVKNIANSEKIFTEQQALYRRVGYKPLLGIVPMMIQIPIIMGLVGVINNPLNYILHINQEIIDAIVALAMRILNIEEAGSAVQLEAIKLIESPEWAAMFTALPQKGIAEALQKIFTMDFRFRSMLLYNKPNLLNAQMWVTGENWLPWISGGAALLMCIVENKINVLQREAGWLNRWGMTIFLVAFSLYFAFIVPAGVAIYWICNTVFGIVIMYALYYAIPPKKYIDYKALDESKEALKRAREFQKTLMPSREAKNREKMDYKRFFSIDGKDKQIVFYSEKSGYYRYFESVIQALLSKSDINIHYITSDPDDVVFQLNNPRILPYYITGNKLTTMFMKMDAQRMIMTMPDLQQFHLKRSYVRDDVEYVYMYHAMGVGGHTIREGALQYYDTLLCVSERSAMIENEMTEINGWKRRALACGYPLLDRLIEAYTDMCRETPPDGEGFRTILIAPSYQEDNILESCLRETLSALSRLNRPIVIRPHPQFLRQHPESQLDLQDVCAKYPDADIRIETDFGSNQSVYAAAMVVTDWSSIAYEYAFTTEKPVLFIDTAMKKINEKMNEAGVDDDMQGELRLRGTVGLAVKPEDIPECLYPTAQELFEKVEQYRTAIAEIRPEYVCNVGHAAETIAEYLLSKTADKPGSND